MSDGFTLNVKLSDDDVTIDVSGFRDIRNGIAALVKVFTDENYVASIWAGLVNGDWGDDEDDEWDE